MSSSVCMYPRSIHQGPLSTRGTVDEGSRPSHASMRCDMIECTVVQENYKLDKVNDQRVPMVSEEAAGCRKRLQEPVGSG